MARIEWTRATNDGLVRLVEEAMSAHGIPGASLAILHDATVQIHSFGVADRTSRSPVHENTVFHWGSISKTATATAVMKLAERGELDIDRTVRTYIPDFRVADETASSSATVRHLLTHATGWAGDLFIDTGQGPNALADYVRVMSDLEQLVPVGVAFSYSNTNYSILGRILEIVGGQSYEDVVRINAFDSAGHGISFAHELSADDDIAIGHRQVNGALIECPIQSVRNSNPAAGIYGSMIRLISYARTHIPGKQTANVLSQQMLETMQSPAIGTNEYSDDMGLGWFTSLVGGERLISHPGVTLGHAGLIMIFPNSGFVLALLTNSQEGVQVSKQVRDFAIKRLLNVDAPSPQPRDADSTELNSICGHYAHSFAAFDLAIEEGNVLIGALSYLQGYPTKDDPKLPNPPPMHIGLTGKHGFVVMDGPMKDVKGTIGRDAAGKVEWIRLGSRIYPAMRAS